MKNKDVANLCQKHICYPCVTKDESVKEDHHKWFIHVCDYCGKKGYVAKLEEFKFNK